MEYNFCGMAQGMIVPVFIRFFSIISNSHNLIMSDMVVKQGETGESILCHYQTMHLLHRSETETSSQLISPINRTQRDVTSLNVLWTIILDNSTRSLKIP